MSIESTTIESDNSLDLGRPKGSRQLKDNLVRVLVWLAAAIAIVPLIWILAIVIVRGAPLLFTAVPDYTKICAVQETAPSQDYLNYKRVANADCDNAANEAKPLWLVGGKPRRG
ncbi:hypothetical protein ACQB6R_12185 [Propionibacteriaceae bacterium G1746]